MRYQLLSWTPTVKKIPEDGMIVFIPASMDNLDWQEYQAWLALGNEPEAAD